MRSSKKKLSVAHLECEYAPFEVTAVWVVKLKMTNPAAAWGDIPDYLLTKKSAFPSCDWKNTHSLADRHFVTCRSFAF